MLRLLLPALVVKQYVAALSGSTQCPTEAKSFLSVKLAASKSSFSNQLLESRMERSTLLNSQDSWVANTGNTHTRTDPASDCFPAVFIVATGRSGSTSLLHMLNTIPGYKLKGENGGSWQLMYNLFRELQELRANSSKEQSGEPWLGIEEDVDLDEVLRGFRSLVLGELNPKTGARVTGFKEIRWDFDHKLADVELLLQAFPCSRVVLNYRMDTFYQAVDSQMVFPNGNAATMDTQTHLYANENRVVYEFHDRFPDRTFKLPVENFTVEAFNDLLHWLGEDEECRYVAVAHSNDMATGAEADGTDSDYISCD